MNRRIPLRLLLAALASGLVLSCSDQGTDPPPENNEPGEKPGISSLLPSRTVAGDTVRVMGENFGDSQSGSHVLFSSGTGVDLSAPVVEGGWSDSLLLVLVPEGAEDGPVQVEAGGSRSEGVPFEVAPELISFQSDLGPFFQQRGCASCHGGSGGLNVLPYAALMAGNSSNGPVVLPRRGPESDLVRKLLPNPPYGQRMPIGGALPDEEVLMVSDWIDQGARNN